jgi:hypothetical protein
VVVAMALLRVAEFLGWQQKVLPDALWGRLKAEVVI